MSNNVVPFKPEQRDDLLQALDEAHTQLLHRVTSTDDVPVSEVTAALKACAAYAEMRGLIKKADDGKEGSFNGFAGTAAKFAAPRRGGSDQSRDGFTNDPEPDAF